MADAMIQVLGQAADAVPTLSNDVRWAGVLIIVIAGIFLASGAVWVAMRMNHAADEIDTTEPEEPA